MANKRNSRVFEDEVSLGDATRQNTTRSNEASGDVLADAAKEIEQMLYGNNKEAMTISQCQSATITSSWDGRAVTTSSFASVIGDASGYSTIPMLGRPENFGVVLPGIYRSSYPRQEDFGFLQSLHLKTIVTLVQKDETDPALDSFTASNRIRHVVYPIKGTKKEAISVETMKDILATMFDMRNYPLLVHCNHGKHRTGCVVGVMRKASGWTLSNVLDEYTHYANPKIRECDLDYLRTFCFTSAWHLPIQSPSGSLRPSQAFARFIVLAAVTGVIWLISASYLVAAPIIKAP